jgi:alpha-1,3/alpha-1,6-mannosyltransferase
MLLKSARLLIYTPSNEHFGIVPLEAMLAEVPVLAANTGGPLETVVDGETGWLCPPDNVEKWSAVMNNVLQMSDQKVKTIGKAGKLRVKSEFSDAKMAEKLDVMIDAMSGPKKSSLAVAVVLSTLGFSVVWGLCFAALALTMGRGQEMAS